MTGMAYVVGSFAVALLVVVLLESYIRTGWIHRVRPGPGRLASHVRMSRYQRVKRALRCWGNGEPVRKSAVMFPLHGVFTVSDIEAALRWIGAHRWDVWERPGHVLIRVPRRFVEPMLVALEPRAALLIDFRVERL
jgi:hypothetical protein